MGKRKNIQSVEKIDCKVCNQPYTPQCDWRQGRCPHHPALVDIYYLRFYNLIQTIKNLFKRK